MNSQRTACLCFPSARTKSVQHCLAHEFVTDSVLVSVPLAAVKHHSQSNLETKGFLCLTRPCHSSSSEKVRTGTETRQEPRARSRCRRHGRVLFAGLLPMVCSICFLLKPVTSTPGWYHLQSAMPSRHSLIKMPDKLAYSLILWRHFLN